MDRTSLTLPGKQLDLILAVASQTATPIVVVLVHGGPLDVSLLMEMPRVTAMLSAGFGGQMAGEALSRVVFGDVAPTGRLPMTFPFENYTAQVSGAQYCMDGSAGCGLEFQHTCVVLSTRRGAQPRGVATFVDQGCRHGHARFSR